MLRDLNVQVGGEQRHHQLSLLNFLSYLVCIVQVQADGPCGRMPAGFLFCRGQLHIGNGQLPVASRRMFKQVFDQKNGGATSAEEQNIFQNREVYSVFIKNLNNISDY